MRRNPLPRGGSLDQSAEPRPLDSAHDRAREDRVQASATTRRSRSAGLERLKDSRLLKEFAYIGGAWRASASGRVVAVNDPASGEWIGQVPALTGAESMEAVTAASVAFPAWSALLPQERARLLRNWH